MLPGIRENYGRVGSPPSSIAGHNPLVERQEASDCPMDAGSRARSTASAAGRVYEDVQPQYRWNPGGKEDVLVVDLRGVKVADGGEFRKEHLRIQIDNYGNLKVSGERPLSGGGNRSCRFQRILRLPRDCDASGIRAVFDNGVLSVFIPKLLRDQPPLPPPSAAAEVAQAPAPPPVAAEAAGKPAPHPGQKPAPGPAHAWQESESPAAPTAPPPPPPPPLAADKGEKEAEPAGRADERQTAPPAPSTEKMKRPAETTEEEEEEPRSGSWEERRRRGARGRRARRLLVSVAVAVVVIAGLGIYLLYRTGGMQRCSGPEDPATSVQKE